MTLENAPSRLQSLEKTSFGMLQPHILHVNLTYPLIRPSPYTTPSLPPSLASHKMRLRELYKVETLDTRFTPKEPGPLPKAQKSQWNTPEYYLYYLVFLTIPVLMFKSVYDVSQPSHPTYKQYEYLLEPGWIPGRKVDNSDAQYRGFRENLPVMAVILVLHPLLRRVWERFSGNGGDGQASANGGIKGEAQPEQRAEARMKSRTRFDLAFAAIFLLALHGISALKVLAILSINYKIATGLPRQHVTLAIWVFNVGILFANELCRGYPLAGVASLILPSTTTNADPKAEVEMGWGAWLDTYGGLLPRWEVLFNITVLKMIAFNFDYLWSLDRRASSPIEVCHSTPSMLSLSNNRCFTLLTRSRRKTSHQRNTPKKTESATAPRPAPSPTPTTSLTPSTALSTSSVR